MIIRSVEGSLGLDHNTVKKQKRTLLLAENDKNIKVALLQNSPFY